MLLQKVDNRDHVREKIDLMYKHADISIPTNRLGLAKGIGLVCRCRHFLCLTTFNYICDSNFFFFL